MARFLNTLFLTVAAFALAFCWFYYYTRLVLVSCICAFLISFALCLIIYALQKVKGRKYRKQAKKREAEKLKNYLVLLPDSRQLIVKALNKRGYTTKKAVGGYLVNKEDNDYLLYVNFSFGKLAENEIAAAVRACKRYKKNNLLFFCNDYTPFCKYIAEKAEIVSFFFDIYAVYALLEKTELLPDLKETKSVKKMNKLLSVALCKERSTAYLLACVSLVFFSTITFYPIYTLCMATVQLALATYSRVNKRFNVAAASPL